MIRLAAEQHVLVRGIERLVGAQADVELGGVELVGLAGFRVVAVPVDVLAAVEVEVRVRVAVGLGAASVAVQVREAERVDLRPRMGRVVDRVERVGAHLALVGDFIAVRVGLRRIALQAPGPRERDDPAGFVEVHDAVAVGVGRDAGLLHPASDVLAGERLRAPPAVEADGGVVGPRRHAGRPRVRHVDHVARRQVEADGILVAIPVDDEHVALLTGHERVAGVDLRLQLRVGGRIAGFVAQDLRVLKRPRQDRRGRGPLHRHVVAEAALGIVRREAAPRSILEADAILEQIAAVEVVQHGDRRAGAVVVTVGALHVDRARPAVHVDVLGERGVIVRVLVVPRAGVVIELRAAAAAAPGVVVKAQQPRVLVLELARDAELLARHDAGSGGAEPGDGGREGAHIEEVVDRAFRHRSESVLQVPRMPGQLANQANVTVASLLKPSPQYGSLTQDLTNHGFSERYHSLQVRLQKRYSNGLSLLGAYTLSKNIGFAGSDTFGDLFGGGGNKGIDTFNRKLEKSIAPIDRAHRTPRLVA